MGDQQDQDSLIRQNVNPPIINYAAHGRNDAGDDNHDGQGALAGHRAQQGDQESERERMALAPAPVQEL